MTHKHIFLCSVNNIMGKYTPFSLLAQYATVNLTQFLSLICIIHAHKHRLKEKINERKLRIYFALSFILVYQRRKILVIWNRFYFTLMVWNWYNITQILITAELKSQHRNKKQWITRIWQRNEIAAEQERRWDASDFWDVMGMLLIFWRMSVTNAFSSCVSIIIWISPLNYF